MSVHNPFTFHKLKRKSCSIAAQFVFLVFTTVVADVSKVCTIAFIGVCVIYVTVDPVHS